VDENIEDIPRWEPLTKSNPQEQFQVSLSPELLKELRPDARPVLFNVLHTFCESVIKRARDLASPRGGLSPPMIEPGDIYASRADVFRAIRFRIQRGYVIFRILQVLLIIAFSIACTDLYYIPNKTMTMIVITIVTGFLVGLSTAIEILRLPPM